MRVAHTIRALKATEIVANLAKLEGWTLSGDGDSLAIEKPYGFANYYQTVAFVNAVAFIAHSEDHHPELLVQQRQCLVRWRSDDVHGISPADFACAKRVDDLQPETVAS
ncbi:4a-hydroxytetrahydrobiopterin dehydratase [Rhodoferax fermentans]|uniref:4a-hydroxytetrahydrobiopterin dehydratase n=1 Tax=Rhodoferax fermentans TaxID=28066 RepID=A0A1T1AQE7_RHOFE|nr:4a-hydroxytetrahydrobiopterin dehydratase [Rhodoferax fermentans]MBK1683481.1 4a-hydroxytetrahydrobiopterin dehydratase [Rhodoferax fermentans]OOV06235.1 pterin-4-alpha-carbinolamine dehydratase [Rhodoferax fermentans]